MFEIYNIQIFQTDRYQTRPRPILFLSDEAGEVNLIADLTQQQATENQFAAF